MLVASTTIERYVIHLIFKTGYRRHQKSLLRRQSTVTSIGLNSIGMQALRVVLYYWTNGCTGTEHDQTPMASRGVGVGWFGRVVPLRSLLLGWYVAHLTAFFKWFFAIFVSVFTPNVFFLLVSNRIPSCINRTTKSGVGR